MIRLGAITLYWPGERRLIDLLAVARHREAKALQQQESLRRDANRALAEMQDELAKAKGIYAGPFAEWQPADGTGFALTKEVVGFTVRLEQEHDQRRRGMLSLEAYVTCLGIDPRAIAESRHVEWQGIKWKAGGARLNVERDLDLGVLLDDRPVKSWSYVTVPLQAFVEFKQPRTV